jgi:hypothetical protein
MSSTCGIGDAHYNLCQKDMTYRLSKSCLLVSLSDIPCRRSMNCGYENHLTSRLSFVAPTMTLRREYCDNNLRITDMSSLRDLIEEGEHVFYRYVIPTGFLSVVVNISIVSHIDYEHATYKKRLSDIPCRRSMNCDYENHLTSRLSFVAPTMMLRR